MIQAWIYPGSPTENAANEYRSASFDVLKPEYLTVGKRGVINKVTVALRGVNGYSAANAADVKAHSKEQYITISSNITNLAALCSTKTKRTQGINVIGTTLTATGFTGIDWDPEPLRSMTGPQKANFKLLLTEMRAKLGCKIMLCMPALTQPHPVIKYEDYEPLVDYIDLMAYDRQWDIANGSVCDLVFLGQAIDYIKTKVPAGKMIVGIPTYGYHQKAGVIGGTIDTLAQSKLLPGFSSATRNADGEMKRTVAGVTYYHQDTQSIDMKIAAIRAKGIDNISLWHLGGNDLPTINAIR